MTMRADLHLHTKASDGTLSPAEMMEAVSRAGLDLCAITDHDTFDGTRTAAASQGVRILQGVELSLRDMSGLHLLAYGCAIDTALHHEVIRLSEARLTRGERILTALRENGIQLDEDHLRQTVGSSFGRPHIAREMVRAGYAESVPDAFNRYLAEGRPYYVAAEKLTMREALDLCRRSGFIPVLAHPCELKLPLNQLEALLDGWQEAGLMGMEVYHPSNVSAGCDRLLKIARRRNLLVTGGSDFHQHGDGRHGEIGCMADAWLSAEDDVAALEAAMRAVQRRPGVEQA